MSNELKPIKSSLIQAYSYDSSSHSLNVVFKDGTELTYSKVEPSVMSMVFDRPGSIGGKFHRFIGKKYQSHQTQEEAS